MAQTQAQKNAAKRRRQNAKNDRNLKSMVATTKAGTNNQAFRANRNAAGFGGFNDAFGPKGTSTANATMNGTRAAGRSANNRRRNTGPGGDAGSAAGYKKAGKTRTSGG